MIVNPCLVFSNMCCSGTQEGNVKISSESYTMIVSNLNADVSWSFPILFWTFWFSYNIFRAY